MTTRQRLRERRGAARRTVRRPPAQRHRSLLAVSLLAAVAVVAALGFLLLRPLAPGPVLPRDNTKGATGVVVEEWEDFL